MNWPGGGGGATMLYYDQGMFEEVNYMTSAIPAEVMVGGVSINMVTKDAGNKWRGDARYNFSSGCLTSTEPAPGCLESDNVQKGIDDGSLPAGFLGNPTKTTYDFNLAGGGAMIKDRLWVNGAVRRWIVDKLVARRTRTDAGDRRQRPEELFGQGRLLGELEPEVLGVVHLEQQDPRSPA